MAGSIVVKQIKPARFKSEAFTAAMQEVAKDVGREMVLDFRETTRSWKNKPKFELVTSVDPNVEVLVGTDDKIYGYVNDGTKPHIIKPKGRWPLRFKWGGKGSYKPKTKPRIIGSTPGGPSGPEVVALTVHHPGTEAREFDIVIEKKWTPRFKRMCEAAMSQGADKSGHAIA
jgi:hypothetical protein